MSDDKLVGVFIGVKMDAEGKFWAVIELTDGRSKRKGPFDTGAEAEVKVREAIAMAQKITGGPGLVFEPSKVN